MKNWTEPRVTIRKPSNLNGHRYEVYCRDCNFVIATEDRTRALDVKRDHESGRAHEEDYR